MVKNILITGGAGYIGSHICEVLSKAGKNLFIVDNLSTGYKKLINKKASFYKVNIDETDKINSIIITNKIDSIIHLAASVVVNVGEKNPNFYFKNNVIGTKKLLNACNKTDVKNFIFSSTAAVYKDGLEKVSEKSNTRPQSVYGKTKLKAERIIKRYCKKNKINYSILRYFNIVGASNTGMIGLINKTDHLFKNFSSECMKKKPVFKIYGNDYNTFDGTCIRDFIHVLDIADLHKRILFKVDKVKKSNILNCGYGKGTSVLEVINAFKKYSKKKIILKYLPRRKGDLIKVVALNNNLKNFIKWKPKYNSLKKMVKSSLDWEKKLI